MAIEAPATTEAQEESPAVVSRRRFLARVSLALSGVGTVAVGVPVVSFLLRPLFTKRPPEWRPVGPVEKFAIGTTTEVAYTDPSSVPWTGISGNTAAWLRRDGPQTFTAYSIHCTHLGCPVRWLPDANLFMCPCHGGVYYKDGSVAAGPPPKPLETYPVRLNNGQVEIQTSPIPIG